MTNNDNCSRCKQVFSRKDIRESICPYCSVNPLNPAKTRETSDKLLPSRDECLNAILDSTSRYRIVVAGPGTGKTYLFKKAINPKSKRNLTLTFVNSLVEDLSLELGNLSDVFTLHSFARRALEKASGKKVKIFPKLTTIISEDAEIILGRKIDFEKMFNKREFGCFDFDFYKKRKDYYDQYYYGFSDMILAAVIYFELNEDRIPEYDQVIVDEFQDFNALELALIEVLAKKNSLLLAGDDDQSVYDSKHANPEYIRYKYSLECQEYKSFNLPYCSRCTRVIIDAANDFIASARKQGFLKNRINKPYLYLKDSEDTDKARESKRYGKLIYAQAPELKMAWFIQKQINKIAEDSRGRFDVLIISPMRKKAEGIVDLLHKYGFVNVEYQKKDDKKKPTLLEGISLLLEDKESSLGWRVVAKALEKPEDFEDLIKRTGTGEAQPFSEMISKDFRKEVSEILTICRKIRRKEKIDEIRLRKIIERAGFHPLDIMRDLIKAEISSVPFLGGNQGVRKIRIKVATVQSSKGLAADYVFMTHIDDKWWFLNKESSVTDQYIRNFLVALTRARKEVFLISTDNETPTFLKWIGEKHIQRPQV